MKFFVALLALVAALVAGVVATHDRNTLVLAMQRCDGASPFSLHGLWPEWAQDCQGDKFNPKVLAPIRRELDVDWRSCPGHSSTNEEFWKHEWSKHGTCSGLDMLGYFNTTMQLLHKYSDHCADMVDVQVAPGYSYPVPNKECRLCLKKNYELC